MPEPKDEEDDGLGPARKLGLSKISMKKWRVAPEGIYEHITGREPEIDKHTGQLVHLPPEGPAGRGQA